jgi:hypothetical protein
MNAPFFLFAVTVIFGVFGAVTYHALFWDGPLQNKQMRIFYQPAFGLACVILLVVSLGTLGVRTHRTSLIIIFGGICTTLLVLLIYKIKKYPATSLLPSFKKEYLVMGVLALVLFTAKLAEIHNVLVPNWVDGLIHVTILQKLAAKGFIPADRIYHTGFHAAAMFIHLLLGTSLSNTILWLGQWAGVLSGLSFYGFLRKNKIHYIFAFLGAILYGTVALFPSYLMAWGRYPFLLGLALVFPAIDSSLEWIKGRRGYFEALILLCALALVHYGSVLIWFSYLVAYFLFIKKERSKLRLIPDRLVRFGLLILPPLAVLIPKGINFLGQKSLQAALLAKLGNPDFGEDINVALSLIQKHDLFLLLFALIVILSAILLKWKPPARFALWPMLVFIFVWMQYLFLGFSITSYINTAIFVSGPIILLFIFALQYIFVKMSGFRFLRKSPQVRPALLLILLLAFITMGLSSSSNLVTPGTTLFTSEDALAMEWIQVHAPQDATFLIQSFIWGNELMPSDGGGWISILTGRKTIYPTEIGEFHNLADYVAAHNIDYIYLGKEFNPNFTLRLEDINIPYQVVFQTENVMILKTELP